MTWICGVDPGHPLVCARRAPGPFRSSVLCAAAALRPDNALPWVELAREHGDSRESARAFCELMYLWARDLLAAKAGAPPERAEAGEVAEVTRAAAASLTAAQIARRAELASEASLAIKQNAGATLAVERMLIGWFHG